MNPVSDTYDRKFFEEHAEGIDEYRRLADCIWQVLGPFKTVTDVGCGPGYVLARMQELGASVHGYEGSEVAREFSPLPASSITTMDIRECPTRRGGFDLVVCTEVAEHLAAEYSDKLVDLLTELAMPNQGDKSPGVIAFTAADVGQGGLDHVNEQPATYWIDKFHDRKWHLDVNRTFAMRTELAKVIEHQKWYTNNFLCFVKN